MAAEAPKIKTEKLMAAGSAAFSTRTLRCVVFAITVTAVLSARQQARSPNAPSTRVGFYDLTPYWNFLFANYTVAVYNAMVMFLPDTSKLWQTAVAFDVIFLALVSSSSSAALAVALLERNGNKHAHWEPIYHQYPDYILRVIFACGLGYGAAFIYLVILLVSLNTKFHFMIDD